MMNGMFNAGLAAYLLALLFAVINLFWKKKPLTMLMVMFFAAGVAIQTVYMGMRWVEAGRAPFSNMFESLVLFAWAIAGVYLVLRIWVNVPVLGAASALMTVLSLAYAATFESDVKPLMPALQSNWLTVHVITCFFGYAGFAVSFLAAVSFLIADRDGSKVLDETKEGLDVASAKTVSFGFLFLTVGIITGAVWANSAWGTYWSWDPKETWALITWLIYVVFLHCRVMRGWRGKRAAWVSIIGFVSVLFTYVGVNFLLKGLHSYA